MWPICLRLFPQTADQLFQACAEHRLDSVKIGTKPGFAVSVILASQGYPGTYPKGKPISIPSHNASFVFHAGTQESNGDLVTAGGRVLAVSAFGATLEEALKHAYEGVAAIQFEGKTFRRDIAHRYAPSLSST